MQDRDHNHTYNTSTQSNDQQRYEGPSKSEQCPSEKLKTHINLKGKDSTNKKYNEASLARRTLRLFLNFLLLCSLAANTVCAMVSEKTMVSKLSCMQ